MFLLVGFGGIFRALPKLSDNAVFRFLSEQCSHAKWHGFTLWDLIFPLFIFIIGVAMPFAFARRLQQENGRIRLYKHILFRTIILFLLGLVYWGTPGGAHPSWGYYSVLYRIGICYFFAGIIVLNTRPRGQAIWAFGLLVSYWLAMCFVSVPGYEAGNFTDAGCLRTGVAEQVSALLSPKLKYIFAVTLIPSVSTVLFGALTGYWLRSSQRLTTKALGLLVAGAVFVAAGLIADRFIPINKQMWSPSFTLLMVGLSLLLLCVFYWLIDVRGYQRWAWLFVVVGMNSITIYIGSRLINFDQIAGVFIGGFVESFGAGAALVTAITSAALKWLFLYYLYVNKIFFKI